jgi:YYY domain-containing protein
MIEIEHLLLVCAWLITYLALQLCTWLILRIWLSSRLALPASFAVSLLCSCLISWYLAWLGFSPKFTLGIVLILTGLVFRVQKARIGILPDLKDGIWYYALFFIVFFAMLVVRILFPDINGGEKFMNHAFLASIMRTPLVPPLDPWFVGGRLDVYYYLGHWCFATLGIISHIPSWVVFQFVHPTVVSVAAVQLYGIGKLLLKRFSLLPVICLFIANPSLVYAYARGVDPFHLFLTSSRTIPETITEYPLFTFLFGGVHAHAMGVFNQTFFIFLIVYLCTQWQKLIHSERTICAILAGISLGTMVGMNSWDALAYGPIFILVAVVIWYQTHRGVDGEEPFMVQTSVSKACVHLYHDVSSLLKKRTEISHSTAAIWYLWILVPLIAFLSYFPFFLMMSGEGVSGVGVVHTKTTLSEFFLVFGWFLLLFVCTLYSDIKKRPYLFLIAIPFMIIGYPLIGFILVLLVYLVARREGVSDFLFGCGLLLVLFCELLYIKDGLAWSDAYRMNTVFKLYFSAWFLLGVGSLCSASTRVERLMDQVCHTKKGAIIEKYLPRLAIGGVLVLILLVPVLYDECKPRSYYKTHGLDGYAWMEKVHPDAYAAVLYLRELSGEYVLVEAEGGYNSHYARISSATGIPSIIGWSHHERMWRGDNPPGWEHERKTDLSIIYEHPERASEIMEKHNANLLIFGALERERYQISDDFGAYLTDLVPIFTAGETVIYQRVQEQN